MLLLDELVAMVRAERQALLLAAVFGSKAKPPDPDEAQRMLDAQLVAPLPVSDPATADLKRALGLTT